MTLNEQKKNKKKEKEKLCNNNNNGKSGYMVARGIAKKGVVVGKWRKWVKILSLKKMYISLSTYKTNKLHTKR